MSLDDAQDIQDNPSVSEVSLDHLVEVLRDALAAEPGEGLARLIKTQIARATASAELEPAG